MHRASAIDRPTWAHRRSLSTAGGLPLGLRKDLHSVSKGRRVQCSSGAKLNGKLIEDKAYWAMVEKGKDFWLDGSMRDSVVNCPG